MHQDWKMRFVLLFVIIISCQINSDLWRPFPGFTRSSSLSSPPLWVRWDCAVKQEVYIYKDPPLLGLMRRKHRNVWNNSLNGTVYAFMVGSSTDVIEPVKIIVLVCFSFQQRFTCSLKVLPAVGMALCWMSLILHTFALKAIFLYI